MNAEYNSEPAMVYLCMGGIQQAAGRSADAIASYKRALEINPEFSFVAQRLEALLQQSNSSD